MKISDGQGPRPEHHLTAAELLSDEVTELTEEVKQLTDVVRALMEHNKKGHELNQKIMEYFRRRKTQ